MSTSPAAPNGQNPASVIAPNNGTPPNSPAMQSVPAPPTAEAKDNANWTDLVGQITKGKEGILVGASVIFGLGYLSTLWNAYQNNLGFIPPVQTQCILAGIFPTAAVAVAWLIVRFYSRCETAVYRAYDANNEAHQARLKIAKSCIKIFVLLFAALQSIPKHPLNLWWFGLLSMTLAAPYVSLCMVEVKQSRDQFFEKEAGELEKVTGSDADVKRNEIKASAAKTLFFVALISAPLRAMVIMPLVFASLLAIAFWTDYGYPNLPQELGGGQPRVADLAVTRAQLSAEMRRALLPPTAQKLPADTSKDPLAVSQTVVVDVVYENSDSLFVRAHEAKSPQGGWRPTVYQIKKASITGVTWRGFNDRK